MLTASEFKGRGIRTVPSTFCGGVTLIKMPGGTSVLLV